MLSIIANLTSIQKGLQIAWSDDHSTQKPKLLYDKFNFYIYLWDYGIFLFIMISLIEGKGKQIGKRYSLIPF